MTTTTAPITTPVTTSAHTRTRVTWKTGLVTAVIAAVASTVVAAAFEAAGHQLGVGAEPIMLLGFTQMALLGSIIGVVLARHTRRTTFVRVTVALTVLSCVPSIALGTGAVDKVGLVLTHLVAAAIVIPRLSPRD